MKNYNLGIAMTTARYLDLFYTLNMPTRSAVLILRVVGRELPRGLQSAMNDAVVCFQKCDDRSKNDFRSE